MSSDNPDRLSADWLARFSTLSIAAQRKTITAFYREAEAEINAQTFGTSQSHSQSHSQSYRATEKLTQIFPVIAFDQDYLTHTRESTFAFADALQNDRSVQLARENWLTMPKDARAALVKHVEVLQDQFYSHSSFQFSQSRAILFKDLGPDDNCYSEFKNGQIGLTTSPGSGWDSLKGTLHNFFHEKVHGQQIQIAKAFERRRLPNTSPFYKQAREFSEFYRREKPIVMFVDATEHPTERQSRDITTMITSVAFDGEKPDYVAYALASPFFPHLTK